MSNIDSTLDERGSRYGDFEEHAFITQDLKAVMQETPNWDLLKADQKEALEMTAHKIGRILNGDPNYIDSWHDIIGYIRLVEQRLEREQTPGAVGTGKAAQAQNEKILGTGRETLGSMPEAQEINPACDCPACTIRGHLEKMFGTNIEVIILTEESGGTD